MTDENRVFDRSSTTSKKGTFEALFVLHKALGNRLYDFQVRDDFVDWAISGFFVLEDVTLVDGRELRVTDRRSQITKAIPKDFAKFMTTERYQSTDIKCNFNYTRAHLKLSQGQVLELSTLFPKPRRVLQRSISEEVGAAAPPSPSKKGPSKRNSPESERTLSGEDGSLPAKPTKKRASGWLVSPKMAAKVPKPAPKAPAEGPGSLGKEAEVAPPSPLAEVAEAAASSLATAAALAEQPAAKDEEDKQDESSEKGEDSEKSEESAKNGDEEAKKDECDDAWAGQIGIPGCRAICRKSSLVFVPSRTD